MTQDIYKKLQRHLDKMPVGYPATRSGVEQRILRRLFSPEEAELAIFLTHRFETAERLHGRAAVTGVSRQTCEAMLNGMAKKGSIFRKIEKDRSLYALVPFVVGMFEFQLSRLSPELYADTAAYFRQGFGLEYLSTAVPQMRVIPVEQSIEATHHIATYDEIRQIIENAGDRIGVARCICRTGRDLIGEPCGKTDRREVCFGFRDYFDTFFREGWLRPVSRDEAMEILRRSEEDGLVLQATNEQEPQAVCACCGCCCGILGTLKNVPNRADFVAGNFVAAIDDDRCVGCGLCAARCHMDAVTVYGKTAAIDVKRCIGCGVCVPACKPGALHLNPKPVACVPPKTTADLYEVILEKKSRLGKIKTAVNILRHMRLKEIRELLRNA